MAAKIACSTQDFLLNTGSNSALLPGAPVMLIAVDKNFKFTLDDLDDAVAFVAEHAHAIGSDKFFPMFGNSVPLDYLSNSDTGDVTETTDRGRVSFVQYGFITKNFGTNGGGLCFAKALQSFNNSNVAFIEIDAVGRWFVKQNTDGTFSGMPTAQVFAPKIGSADFKTLARTNFSVSYDPISVVQGKILVTDAGSEILNSVGLINLEVSAPADVPSTVTLLKVALTDDCCGDSVASELGADLLDPTNFIVTDIADGSIETVTSVTLAGEVLELHGTWVSGKSYKVEGSGSDVWYTNELEGWEVTKSVIILVP